MWKRPPTMPAGYRRPDAEHHVADLADGVVGEQAFVVLLDQRHHDREQDGDRADDHEHRADPGPRGQLEEIQGDARKEVDPQQLVDARRQDCHEGQRRVDGRVRDPAVKRHGPGLADGARHEEEEGGSAQAVQGKPDGGHRECACQPAREHDAEHHAEVGDPHDDECLDGGGVRPAAAGGDHGELGQQESFAEEQQKHQVVRQHHPARHGQREEHPGVKLAGAGRVHHEGN